MRKITILFILINSLSWSQSKSFKAFSKTFIPEENSYLKTYNWESFFESGIAQEALDLENVDQELLSATVFFTFNKIRAKKRRAPLAFNQKLYKSVYTYGNYYRLGSFKRRDGNIRKARKCVKYVATQEQYHGAFQKVFIQQSQAINKKKRASYHYDRKAEEGTGYYYGDKPKVKDSVKELKPIEPYTYEEFANEVVKMWFRGSNAKFSKGKAYTEGACYVFIHHKNVRKRYIPYARVLLVIGGRRMLLIPDT